ncbi:2-phospho-L-lactate transferase CofD family protein, partial [Vibrio alginolyticus]
LLLPELGKAIAANRKAKVIFVANLSPEYGPAGRMSMAQKLEWCERACQGRRIDVVLAEETDQKVLEQWNVVTESLASTNRDWRHDRDKLKAAIENQLLTK